MNPRRWLSLVLCGAVAGVVWNLISVASLAAFAPNLAGPVAGGAPHAKLGGEFFYVVDIAMGIWVLWLYSALEPKYGRGPRAAVIAGVAWWIIKTLQSAKWAGLGFVDIGASLIPTGAATLVAAIVATAVGAWLFRKVSDSAR